MGGALSSVVQTLIAVVIAWAVSRTVPIAFLPAFILIAGGLILAGLVRSCGDWWSSGEADSRGRRLIACCFRLVIGGGVVALAVIYALRYAGS